MPNFAISDMAPATLPLDLPNTWLEIQTEEGGVQVSRKAQASEIGGVGGVVSVNSGANITIDNADPANPIVNLDAAITGVDVNGVTLSNAGVATDFLNEEGNYVAAGGASGPCLSTPIIDSPSHTFNAADAEGTTVLETFAGYNYTCNEAADLSFPIGASHDVYSVFAFATCTAGATSTLTLLDGVIQQVVASVQVANGGFWTVYRASATSFLITGAGFL